MRFNKKFIKFTLGAFLFITLIAFANTNDPAEKNEDKDNNERTEIISPSELNSDFITNVYDNSTQKEARFLASIIAEFDVNKSPQFEGRSKSFKTIFKSDKGMAEVTYDKEGRVIAVEKRLANIMLPAEVQKKVGKRYGEWSIVQNKYNISYKQGFDVKKYYTITVQRGNEKKIIRMIG